MSSFTVELCLCDYGESFCSFARFWRGVFSTWIFPDEMLSLKSYITPPPASIIDLETRRKHFVSRLGGKMNKDRNNLVKWKRRMRCQYLISSNLVLNTYDYDLILSAWTNKFFALNLSFRILFIRDWIFNWACKAWIFISINEKWFESWRSILRWLVLVFNC